ncbi:MAG: aminotransferase class I/II-fold pyridoxal phosphate-dependent enzyme [Gammaproteobacteria bacterium]
MPAAADTELDERAAQVLMEVADRLRDNYPYFHPLYAGQMLKPPHPLARLAYGLAQQINPNNHALDGGRASSAMEKEAVVEIASLFAWDHPLGHLTSGGTFANLEALWVGGQLAPGKTVLASSEAHYTHGRISQVLQLPFETVASDRFGRMDVQALSLRLAQGDVGMVVVTAGTTAMGAVDSIDDILALRDEYKFRVHVDAAYGGYFRLVDTLEPRTRAALTAISQCDSVVIDPHKHGLQPYGCGCVLFADPAVGRFYRHDSPYTYFTSDELHLGEISLECSRAGASAVALWSTQRLLPLQAGGEFAAGLAAGRDAAVELFGRLRGSDHWSVAWPPELDIVCWAPTGSSASAISRRTQAVFDEAARQHLHLAMVSFPSALLQQYWPDVDFDQDQVTCLRSCLMKPEHTAWLDAIWDRLEAALVAT